MEGRQQRRLDRQHGRRRQERRGEGGGRYLNRDTSRFRSTADTRFDFSTAVATLTLTLTLSQCRMEPPGLRHDTLGAAGWLEL